MYKCRSSHLRKTRQFVSTLETKSVKWAKSLFSPGYEGEYENYQFLIAVASAIAAIAAAIAFANCRSIGTRYAFPIVSPTVHAKKTFCITRSCNPL
ncbi:hypothetical protein POVWA2_033670 [Plasmodium ovale wallikeri]|uniref:Uncharacterized protein n=1 Tax=Plasmodium ovale wallikeri TaxID=864142 RepID=A0A1A8YYL9_PLAOA|nr:hypothetical protein POVWA1_034520 [Plasmodium ovale wallikeri]SBT37357.1 hypothetical protein POVWA2_033670 [Plasmodium ovale wallikeri]